MCDITFSCGQAVFDHNSKEQDLSSATMVMLLFTTQKNGVKGEVVGQGPSGDPLLCLRDSLSRRIIHLCKHNADKTRPIASFMTPKGSWKHVTPTMITKVLKGAVSLSGEVPYTLCMGHFHRCIFFPPAPWQVHQGKIRQDPFPHVQHHILLWTIRLRS